MKKEASPPQTISLCPPLRQVYCYPFHLRIPRCLPTYMTSERCSSCFSLSPTTTSRIAATNQHRRTSWLFCPSFRAIHSSPIQTQAMVNPAPTIAHAVVRGGIKVLASRCRAGLQAKCRRFWNALLKLWKRSVAALRGLFTVRFGEEGERARLLKAGEAAKTVSPVIERQENPASPSTSFSSSLGNLTDSLSGYEASQFSASAPPTPPPNPSPSPPTNLAKKRLGRHTALSLLANSGVDSWTDYPLSTSPRLSKGEIQDVLWKFGNARRARKEVGFASEFRKAGRVRGRVGLGEWTWEGALSG